MNGLPDFHASAKLLWAERLAWAFGVLCLTVWGVARIDGNMGARRELRRFGELRARGAAGVPDQSLWSPGRVRAWKESLRSKAPAPLAVLRIPKIGLEVPVLEGTDDLTLNRGVGHIRGTAAPGAPGNLGIAGHRDGFFRGLKDVAPGDAIELQSLTGYETYVVQSLVIVEPEDVSVLGPTPSPSLTLVSCYPFYYVGSAPQRYIVRAARTSSAPPKR
jgi:sortase A